MGKLAAIFISMSLFMSFEAFSSVKSINIDADLENIPDHSAGECFYPQYETDEDDGVEVVFGNPKAGKTDSPIVPKEIEVHITSDTEALDDDLEIMGSGIRSAYIDMVSLSGDEAEGRILVYPFYELISPDITVDSQGMAGWGSVPYSRRYEIVIEYSKDNGDISQIHKTTANNYLDVKEYFTKAGFGMAVRALPTEESGFMDVTSSLSGGIVSWDRIADFTGEYKVKISYTNNQGSKISNIIKTQDNSIDISSYVNSAINNDLEVKVYTVPRSNDAKYYNIAISEWGTYGAVIDTSKYDTDDKWAFLEDYKSTNDGNFASGYSGDNAYSSIRNQYSGSGNVNSYFVRDGYRLKYLTNGRAFSDGWIKIEGSWYYFDETGYMHTGWLQDGDKYYYLEETIGRDTGKMLTSSRNIGGVDYEFGQDGVCLNK